MGNNIDEFIGCKATFRVKHEDNLISAQIQNVDTVNRTITFHKVTVHEPGKPDKVFITLQQYHIDELIDFVITDEVDEALKQASLGKKVERNGLPEHKKKKGLNEKHVPRHLNNLLELDTTSLYMMNIVQEQIERTKDENGQYESTLPPDCTLLDNTRSKLFKQAIDHLRTCFVVGVSFQGVNLGRKGQLSWILVSTEEHTMYFDIKALGTDGFDAGLRDLLQSPKVMKVIHDCRRPSDLLYHQYKIKLVNIFDTQVGAAHTFKLMNNNCFPRYVINLADCLRSELHLSDDEVHVPFLRKQNPQEDEEIWNLRPAPSIVYEWMHRHSRYLLALRDRQMELLLSEFTLGVDLYLENLRDLYDGEAEIRMTLQHMMPTIYSEMPVLLKAKLRDEQKKQKKVIGRHEDGVQKDANGFIENWTGISHPRLIGSRDTIWHMKSNGPARKEPEKLQGRRKETGTTKSPPDSCCSRDTGDGVQQASVSGKESLEGNDQRNPLDTSIPGTPRGSDMKAISSSGSRLSSETNSQTMPVVEMASASAQQPSAPNGQHSSSVDGAEKSRLDAESDLKERVAALLSQVSREQQKKEKKGATFPEMTYVFKPAGHEMQPISKKKQAELESSQTVNRDGLASKSVTSSPILDQNIEHEFDAIPCQSKLAENRLKQPVNSDGFFYSSSQPEKSQQKTQGFDITTFKEAVPPPPYTVSKQTGKTCPVEALAAILPRVENLSLLLDGSRTTYSSHHSSGNSGQQQCSGTEKAVISSPAPCSNSNPLSKQGGLLTSNPTRPHPCDPGSDNSARLTASSGPPLASPQTIEKEFDHGVSRKGSGQVRTSGTHAQKGAQDTTINTNGASDLNPASRSSSSSSSVSQETGVSDISFTTPSSAAHTQTVGNTRASGLSQPSPRSAGSVSSSSSPGTGSPSAASPHARSPRTGANPLPLSEIQKALAKGESVMSILGYKKTPQEMLASRMKSSMEQTQK